MITIHTITTNAPTRMSNLGEVCRAPIPTAAMTIRTTRIAMTPMRKITTMDTDPANWRCVRPTREGAEADETAQVQVQVQRLMPAPAVFH